MKTVGLLVAAMLVGAPAVAQSQHGNLQGEGGFDSSPTALGAHSVTSESGVVQRGVQLVRNTNRLGP
jgi:hypothetical protein